MIEVPTDEIFRDLVRKAMSELSADHMAELKDVTILVADWPTELQAEKIKLRGDQLLLGLYEGIPRTQRSGYESGIMADTITLFKAPLATISRDEADLYQQIKQTVWHEIAHYYGLDHDRIHELENRNRR